MTEKRTIYFNNLVEECKVFLIMEVQPCECEKCKNGVGCDCPMCFDGYCKERLRVDDFIAMEKSDEGHWIYLHYDEPQWSIALTEAATEMGLIVNLDEVKIIPHFVEEHFAVRANAYCITSAR